MKRTSKNIQTHPDDPRVPIIFNENLFLEIIKENPETPCIYRRPISGALRKVFGTSDTSVLRRQHTILITHFDEKSGIELSAHPLNTAKQIYIPDCKVPTITELRSDVEDISRIVAKATGSEWQLTFLFGNRDDSDGMLHTHPMSTFSYTWRGDLSSKWNNLNGEPVYATVGDLLYIPPKFPHGSPEKTKAGDERFLGVWQADDLYYLDLIDSRNG